MWSETHCTLTQMALHTGALVLLKLCNGITEQRDDQLLWKHTHTHTLNYASIWGGALMYVDTALRFFFLFKELRN